MIKIDSLLIRDSDITRFWQQVNKDGKCWLYTGACNPQGYGQFHLDSQKVMAHRFAFFIQNGYIDNRLLVLHRCDTPSCVTRSCLFQGTNLVNSLDKERKGRANHSAGESHSRHKLTASQVQEIRSIQGKLQREIAAMYGITRGQVGHILQGRAWKN